MRSRSAAVVPASCFGSPARSSSSSHRRSDRVRLERVVGRAQRANRGADAPGRPRCATSSRTSASIDEHHRARAAQRRCKPRAPAARAQAARCRAGHGASRCWAPYSRRYREKPALDAYEALVVTPLGLTLIRDERLRSDLAGFADRASEPYSGALRGPDLPGVHGAVRRSGCSSAGLVARDAAPAESFAELLSDPAFQEHLAYRYVLERDVAADYADRLREAQGYPRAAAGADRTRGPPPRLEDSC